MSAPQPATTMAGRIEAVLQGVELDCSCREKVSQAIGRFEALESSRQTRRALEAAKDQRDRIMGLISLLAELDEIGWQERDRTVFREMAALFKDVSEAASVAAQALDSLQAP